MTDPTLAPDSQPEASQSSSQGNYGFKKDGTPKKKPGKKKGSVVTPNSSVPPASVPAGAQGLSELTQLSKELKAEEDKKEKAFKKELEEIIKDADQYEGFPDLQLNAMLSHPKTLKTLFAATLKKVKSGDSKVISRVIDHLVGKPRQQVEISTPESKAKVVIGQFSDEELVAFAKKAAQEAQVSYQTQLPAPVGTTNEVTSTSEPENQSFDPSNPQISQHGPNL